MRPKVGPVKTTKHNAPVVVAPVPVVSNIPRKAMSQKNKHFPSPKLGQSIY